MASSKFPQRSLALSAAKNSTIAVPVIGFVSDALVTQREQFILVNKVKPPSRGQCPAAARSRRQAGPERPCRSAQYRSQISLSWADQTRVRPLGDRH
jgi:hypothetical protein